jgi:hypothetical protein
VASAVADTVTLSSVTVMSKFDSRSSLPATIRLKL